ncbi:MAG: 4Fe-4S dicluster domain-containing protein, partial [Firmicutes bacterium]|nr:4Fe-4S dicluster domain-containing protein [Bacillota bacterium]
MSKGVLVDLTKCVGCGSCTVACKLYNDNEFEKKSPAVGLDPKLTDENWTVVSTKQLEIDNEPTWRFVKQQCLHCEEPACVSACFARALQKTEEGPVIYYPHLCVGCRYCMIACPFDIPKYEWEKAFPLITKCQMCSGKVFNGEAPACVSVCPTDVMTFGDREEMLALAKKTVESDGNYVKHIYGEKEAGGT